MIYLNPWCVMAGINAAHSYIVPALTDPTAPGLDHSGPGMSAPTLLATGWLKPEQGIVRDIGEASDGYSGRVVLDLAALRGAPGYPWTGPPMVLRHRDLLVEYRVKDPNGADRAIPDPGKAAGGWLVLHRSDPRSTPSALLVGTVPAEPGAMLVLGKDNPTDIQHLGPPKVEVLSFDAAAQTVHLAISRRPAMRSEGSTPYGGVRAGGGGLIWTPSGGFTPVPPHSPLLHVLVLVSKLHTLQELSLRASNEEVAGISERTEQTLQALQGAVRGLNADATLSPLSHALASISELARISESHGDKRARELLELSRERLGEVSRILADAVEEEREN